jgi:hypothetical protein
MRTMTRPLDLLTPVWPREEVRSADLLALGRATNGIMDQCRGPLVHDYRRPRLLADVSDVLYYRPRMSRCTEEDWPLYAWALVYTLADGAGFEVIVREPLTPSACTWVRVGAVPVASWVYVGQLQAYSGAVSAGEWMDVEVETVRGAGETCQLLAVLVNYSRIAATLPATLDVIGHPYFGGYPIDAAQHIEEGPVSVARVGDMHDLLIRCWQDQVGQIVTAARPTASPWVEFEHVYCASHVPYSRGLAAQPKIWVYCEDTDTANNTVTVTLESGATQTLIAPQAGVDWLEFGGLETPDATGIERFDVYFGQDVEAWGVSGYWMDTEYVCA